MRKIRFHFYVSGDYDKWLSHTIGEIGWLANKKDILKYLGKKILISHEEVEFVDRCWDCHVCGLRQFTPGLDCRKGVCFSSASRGDRIGVRFAPSSEILRHPERWLSITVDLPDEIEQRLFDAAKKIEGRGYDFIGVLFKLTPFDFFQAWWRYYCSEAVNWVALKAYWDCENCSHASEFTTWLKWRRTYDVHRRWSPVANLILMLKAGFFLDGR